MSTASDPPVTLGAASPRRIVSTASPTAPLPVAQAETTAMFGPRRPRAMAICPDAVSTSMFWMKVGLTLFSPRSWRMRCCSRKTPSPPAALPKMTPISSIRPFFARPASPPPLRSRRPASSQWQRGEDARDLAVVQGHHVSFLADAPDQPREHLAGPDLEKFRAAASHHLDHG